MYYHNFFEMRINSYYLFVFVLIICHIQAQGQSLSTPEALTNELFIADDNNHTWTSSNYPQPYASESQTLIVKVDLGFAIKIIIEELELDTANGDFLLIKAGETLNDENKGKVFTHILKNARKYVIDHSSVYMSFQVLGKNEAQKKGFSLTYSRVGEPTVTTESPTTVITWPTPSETDHIYFTGNVSGKTQEDFAEENNLNNFKSAVVYMATKYCNLRNISLTDNITILNVQISNLVRCPYNWPESETCVKIRFSVPVFLKENSTSDKYQLSADNLEQMWTLFADESLEEFSMLVYKEPNNHSNLILWVSISCITLLVFTVILFMMKTVSKRITSFKNVKRRASDTTGIVENEMRPSKMSLDPHPLQVTPPFFDKDYSFRPYEPEIEYPTKPYHSDYTDSDDDSEINDIYFRNSRNNIIENNTESVT